MRIADPRREAVVSPYTFFLPTLEELGAIGAGDYVKLIFEHQGEQYSAERMWVLVTDAATEALKGTLANEPKEAPLRHGALVEFKRHQVIQIDWSEPSRAPVRSSRREYWERCLVDWCVLDGSKPVEYLHREEPDMTQAGDRYADSGWRIHGRRGGESDEATDGRGPAYVAVGVVLNRDDSWLHLLDAPTGAAFRRDFDTGVYLPA